MLTEKELIQIATNELIRIFGKKYLRENYEKTCRSYGFINNSLYQFFVGIKSKKDLPNRKSNEKGWVVYGSVLINLADGKIVETKYATE